MVKVNRLQTANKVSLYAVPNQFNAFELFSPDEH